MSGPDLKDLLEGVDLSGLDELSESPDRVEKFAQEALFKLRDLSIPRYASHFQLPEFQKAKEEIGKDGEYIFQIGNEVWAIDAFHPQSVLTICRIELKEGEKLESLDVGAGEKLADLDEEGRMEKLISWAKWEKRVWEQGLAQLRGPLRKSVVTYESDKKHFTRNTSRAVGGTDILFARAAKVLTGKVPTPVSAGAAP